MNFGLNKVTGTGRQTVEMLKHKIEDLENKGVPDYTLLEETDPEFADYISVYTRELDGVKVYHLLKGNIAFYVSASWVLMTSTTGSWLDPADDHAILQDIDGEEIDGLEDAIGTVEQVGDYFMVSVAGTYASGTFDLKGGTGTYLEFYYVEDDSKVNVEPIFYKR